MTDRLRYIKPDNEADPGLVARALRLVATAMDSADDKTEHLWLTSITEDTTAFADATAWRDVALIIADMADVNSVELRGMAVTIDKEEPHARIF